MDTRDQCRGWFNVIDPLEGDFLPEYLPENCPFHIAKKLVLTDHRIQEFYNALWTYYQVAVEIFCDPDHFTSKGDVILPISQDHWDFLHIVLQDLDPHNRGREIDALSVDVSELFSAGSNQKQEARYDAVCALLCIDQIMKQIRAGLDWDVWQIAGLCMKLPNVMNAAFDKLGERVALEDLMRKVKSEMARKGANARLAKDHKQKEKGFVYECWQKWQELPASYSGKAAFARDMLDKCEHLTSQKKIEDWCREWEINGATEPAG